MKIPKLLLTCLLVVGSAGAALAVSDGTIAAQHIYIVGSTAYQPSVTTAIEDMLGGKGNFSYAYVAGSHGEYNGAAATFSGTIASTAASQGIVNGGTGTAIGLALADSGSAVVIETYWTGSLAGTVDVSATNSVTGFVPDGYVPATLTGSSVGSSYTPASHTANVAMSDAFSGLVAASLSGATNGTKYTGEVNGAGLTEAGTKGESVVGIVPFVWVAGAEVSGSTPPYTNMTQQAACRLCLSGRVPAMALQSSTAAVTNTNDWVFLVGRNEDSGTRIDAQAESQLGIPVPAFSFGQTMKQLYVEYTYPPATGNIAVDGTFPSDDTDNNGYNLGPGGYQGGVSGTTYGVNEGIQTGGTNCSVLDAGLWPNDAPLNTESTVNWNVEGHSGYITGGDVTNVLEAVNPLYLNMQLVDGGDGVSGITWDSSNSTDKKQKAYLIGYLGTSNAYGIPASAGCTILSYNGVPYAPENVLNGSYTFWTFEHMFYRKDGAANSVGASGLLKTIADDIADIVYEQDAQTDSKGYTDTFSPPATVSDVSGIYFNKNLKFTRSAEGQPPIPSAF